MTKNTAPAPNTPASNSPAPKFPKGGIHKHVRSYIASLGDLTGKTVVDIPCGDGRSTYEFIKKGATVIPLDLFPEAMTLEGVQARYADLSESLPLEDNSVDFIICQEGIEHIPNQLFCLQEFNRVLKKGGQLIVTTPSNSHVRARLAHFFLESDYWKRMSPTEIDGVWFSTSTTNKLYFGHLFLVGVQHLQSLLTFTGFKTATRLKSDLGNTSIILGTLLYPLFALITLFSYLYTKAENPHVEKAARVRILWERVKLNLSPTTLFCKHIFWVMEKENSLEEAIAYLKKTQRLGKD